MSPPLALIAPISLLARLRSLLSASPSCISLRISSSRARIWPINFSSPRITAGEAFPEKIGVFANFADVQHRGVGPEYPVNAPLSASFGAVHNKDLIALQLSNLRQFGKARFCQPFIGRRSAF